MNVEEALLQHPEIVNPYSSGSRSSNDHAFVRDLSLDTLLSSVPFSSDNTRYLAKEVITNLDSDIETVKYRQDALEELIKNPELRENVRIVVLEMREIEGKLRRSYSNLTRGLELLRTYIYFMQNLPDLESAQSEAISSVRDYLKQVRDSDKFSEMCELGNLKNNFDLNELGEIIKDYLDNNLRDRWSGLNLNGLGEIIKDYLDNKFSSVIKGDILQIEQVTRLIGPLDFYRSFSDYFAQLQERGFDISRPTLLPKEERRMRVKNARNPLLMEARNNDHKVVPNDIEYNPNKNLFVITGPNNGGKTTYVKTVGLIQLMAQSGLFVPAESAEVSFTDGIYTHFVAPDDITKGEGRYRNELRRMGEIFERATPYSLVILDEPCGGTSYEEGLRQSLALLDGFHKLGSATYFTTHMHPLTREVDNGRYPAGSNFQVECIDDGEKLKYTYRVIPGSSEKSYGEEIAREIGLRPENILETIFNKADERGYKKLLR